jgi:hypothetical protein
VFPLLPDKTILHRRGATQGLKTGPPLRTGRPAPGDIRTWRHTQINPKTRIPNRPKIDLAFRE